jgi:dihydrofolate reductase
MRKVIYSINVSLDGCVSHDLSPFTPDDEFMDHYTRQMREVETLVYGRKIYQMMVPYWPDMAKHGTAPDRAEKDFAEAFAAVKQFIVFSRTLKTADRPNTTLLHGDPAEEVRRLKQEAGGDLHVSGVDVPSQLMRHGLIDEFRLLVIPIVAGTGPRLMEGAGLPERQRLRLLESKTFKSGCVYHCYEKA